MLLADQQIKQILNHILGGNTGSFHLEPNMVEYGLFSNAQLSLENPNKLDKRALKKLLHETLGVAPDKITFAKKLLFLDDPSKPVTVHFESKADLLCAIHKCKDPGISHAVQKLRDNLKEKTANRRQIMRACKQGIKQSRAARAAKIKRQKPYPIQDGSLVPEGLCIVHATHYKPTITADGSITIQSSAQATNWDLARCTIHTALNHKVQPNWGGSWESAPYTIIGDFNSTVKANGLPYRLNTVDTFWVADPVAPFKVPHAHLVQPGVPATGLREIGLRQSVYKNTDFTVGEMCELTASGAFAALLEPAQINTAQYQSLIKTIDPAMSARKFLQGQFNLNESTLSAIEEDLSQRNNRQTVNHAINHLGYSVQNGGSYEWGERDDVYQATLRLASKLGTEWGAHHGTDFQKMETREGTKVIKNESIPTRLKLAAHRALVGKAIP